VGLINGKTDESSGSSSLVTIRDSEVREMPEMRELFGCFARENMDSDGVHQMDTWVVDLAVM
jgi:hypothetical protein